MTRPDAKERWAQRVLGGLGARPVGHTDPVDDEGPEVPVTPASAPVPEAAETVVVPPRDHQRIPDWWRQGRFEIKPGDDQPPVGLSGRERTQWYLQFGEEALKRANDAPAPEPDPEPEPESEEVDKGDELDDEKPGPAAPAPGGPVEKVTVDGKRRVRRRTSVREKAEQAGKDERLRIAAFNGSAAGVGIAFGLFGLIADYLPYAEQAAVGTIGLVLAATAGWAAWKVTGHPAVRNVFRDKTPILRMIVTPGAAEVGRRFAPVPVEWLNAHGQEWGLGPSAISLLLTAGGICFGFWWFIDRHTCNWHWTARWLFRVPLATAVLATLWHTGTPVV